MTTSTLRVLHRLMRSVLPAKLRSKMGYQMEETFLQRVAEEGGGIRSLGILLVEGLDIAKAGVETRLHTAPNRREPDSPSPRRRGHGQPVREAFQLLTTALRSARRAPGITFFVVMTLGIGVGGATAVFSGMEQLIIRPFPYADMDRMVTMWRTIGNSSRLLGPTAEQREAWREETTLFESMESFFRATRTLSEPGTPQRVQVMEVSPTFFSFLGVTPHLGQLFSLEDSREGAPNVALISEELWVSRFGSNPAILGATLGLNDELWTILGVIPKGTIVPFILPTAPEVWIPLREGKVSPSVVAKVWPEISLPVLQGRLDELTENMEQAGVDGGEVGLGSVARPVRGIVANQVRDPIRILAAAVIGILLIATANISNLLLFRGSSRRRETAVRSALGASRRQILKEQMAEGMVQAIMGGTVGILIAIALTGGYNRLIVGVSPYQPVSLNLMGLGFALTCAMATAITFNILPAIRLSKTAPGQSLTGGVGVGGTRKDRTLRWALVIGEVALSFALVVGAGLLIKSVSALRAEGPGFDIEHVARAELEFPPWEVPSQADREVLIDQLTSNVSAHPDITSVSFSSGVPPRVSLDFGIFQVENLNPGTGEVEVFFGNLVDDRFFETIGLPLISGRTFTEAEVRNQDPVAMVSETVARDRWPAGVEPIGTRFRVGEDSEWLTVVGVVGDVQPIGLGEGVELGQIYHPRSYENGFLIARSAGDATEVLPDLRNIIMNTAPEALVLSISTSELDYQGSIARERYLMWLLVGFAGIALFLAILGLYGVLSQVVGSKKQEIGLRISLGAEPHRVLMGIVSSAIRVGVVGIGLGAVLAVFGQRVVQSQLFGVSGLDLTTFVFTGIMLLLTTALASVTPARRASRIDPVRALQGD